LHHLRSTWQMDVGGVRVAGQSCRTSALLAAAAVGCGGNPRGTLRNPHVPAGPSHMLSVAMRNPVSDKLS
jgi:hypothetical protein